MVNTSDLEQLYKSVRHPLKPVEPPYQPARETGDCDCTRP